MTAKFASEPLFHHSVVYRDRQGNAVLDLPADWPGIPFGLHRSQVSAERGPCHSVHPALIYSYNIDGKRWHRENGRLIELPVVTHMLESLGRDYQREWARWEVTPGFTVGLQFTPGVLRRLAPDLDSLDLATAHAFFDDRLAWLIRELVTQAQQGTPDGALYVEGLSCALLALLAARHGVRRARPARVSGLSASCRASLVDFVEANLGEELSIATLAAHAGLSPSHFAHCFAVSFGLPPHRYLLRRRIEEARRLLGASSLSITEIGLRVGFSTHAHFTRAFRRHTGLTPMQARRS